MINGKFFTGLPEKMIERSTGPNRQKTNFYWPDETDSESVSETVSKRRQKRTQEKPIVNFPEPPSTPHIEPKDLLKKQLTSKIQFYDTMDPKSDNFSSPSKPRNDLTQNKIKEAFTSKIEFYDFVDNQNTAVPRTDKNSKKELEKNAKNSPKTKDKRIKFVEQEQRVIESPPKSILKNNETFVKPKTSEDKPNKKLVTKRNISKSVENLSRSKSVGDFVNENSIKIIENDVKNLSLRKQNYDDDDLGEHVDEKQEYKSATKTKSKWGQPRKEITIPIQYNEDSPDEEPKTRSHNLRENKPDFDRYHWGENSRDSNKRSGPRNMQHNDDDDDDDYLHYTKQNTRPKLRRGVLKSDTMETQSNEMSSHPPTLEQQQNNRSIQNYGNISKRSSMVNNIDKSPTTIPPPSDKNHVNRAHRHLVSNISSILFGGSDNDNETVTNKAHKSARNSAVTRVSVGLPD